MKTIVQISINHSNSLDLVDFLENLKNISEELTEDYMQDDDQHKNKMIDIEIESFSRMKISY